MLVPCQVCGPACSKVCDGVSVCAARRLSRAHPPTPPPLSPQRCLCPANRPSPIFVIFSALTNVALLVFAVVGLADDAHGTDGMVTDYAKTNTGLGVFIGIAVLNMVFACYLYRKFSRMTSPEADTSPHAAAVKLCMYDIGVFVYLIFAVFMIVWTFLDFSCLPKGTYVCDNKMDMLEYCRYATWFYLVCTRHTYRSTTPHVPPCPRLQCKHKPLHLHRSLVCSSVRSASAPSVANRRATSQLPKAKPGRTRSTRAPRCATCRVMLPLCTPPNTVRPPAARPHRECAARGPRTGTRAVRCAAAAGVRRTAAAAVRRAAAARRCGCRAAVDGAEGR